MSVRTSLGTPCEILSRADLESFVWVRFNYSAGPEIGQLQLINLRADGGAQEIDKLMIGLPTFQLFESELKKRAKS